MIVLSRNLANRGVVINPQPASGDEEVVVDLHVGETYQLVGDANSYQLKNGAYLLQPGHCVLLSTRERVELPSNVFGVMCSRGSVAAKGLYVGNTKIDPLFSASLNVPVFNASNRAQNIKAGEPFCSVYFHTLEQPLPNGRSKTPPKMPAKEQNFNWQHFWAEHKSQIIPSIVTFIITVAVSLGGMYAIQYAQTSAVAAAGVKTAQLENRKQDSEAQEQHEQEEQSSVSR